MFRIAPRSPFSATGCSSIAGSVSRASRNMLFTLASMTLSHAFSVHWCMRPSPKRLPQHRPQRFAGEQQLALRVGVHDSVPRLLGALVHGPNPEGAAADSGDVVEAVDPAEAAHALAHR